MDASEQHSDAQGRLKVFVSYSRADLAFADQLVLALEDKGFEPLLDRHDIDAAEKWKDRLGALIFSCDTVVFVLSETSANSPICRWEVEHAANLGKRMIPVTPGAVDGVTPPPQLAELNYIPFYSAPAVPGSGFYAGVQKLTHALKADLPWLRQQTRLSEQAAAWVREKPDDLLLRGVALEEALDWRTRAPKSAQVLAQVRDYIAASETAGEQRKAEAAAQIAERETALKQAEDALKQKEQADKRRRRATLIGGGVAAVLIVLAGWMSWNAARSGATAARRNSELFAREAAALAQSGDHARAMLMALHGDPAARRLNWFERLFVDDEGFPSARNALVAATTHNRLERVLVGHSKAVTSVAFSPNGDRVLSGSEDGTARIWRVNDGAVLTTFEVSDWVVTSVAFAPDGTRVLTGSGETATIWPAAGGPALASFEHARSVASVAFSPDGTRVLTGGQTNRIEGVSSGAATVWPAVGGPALANFQPEHPVTSVAFSPDGTRVLTGSSFFSNEGARGGTATIWPAAGGPALADFQHEDGVTSVAFFPDGTLVVTGSPDGTVRAWPTAGGRARFNWENGDDVTSVAVSRDGTVLTGSSHWDVGDGSAKLWPSARTQAPATFEHADYVHSVAFSPDGNRVLTGAEDGTVRIWLAGMPRTPSFEPQGQVSSVAFSADGSRVLTGTWDGVATIWPAAGGPALTSFRTDHSPVSVAFSPDGNNVLVWGDGRSEIWPVGGREAAVRFWGEPAAFAPDGTRVATAFLSYIRIWPAAGGEAIAEFKNDLENDFVTSIAFSRDGTRLLVGSNRGAKIWPAAGGSALASLPSRVVVTAVAFSPEGDNVLIGTANGATIWPANGGPARASFAPGSQVNSVSFDPSGRYVLTASRNRAAVWPAAGGPSLASFEHRQTVESAVFSPEGRELRVLTGSSDHTARVWEIPPIVFASPREQVRMACDRLRSIGMIAFTEADRLRFPILRGEPESPCPPARR